MKAGLYRISIIAALMVSSSLFGLLLQGTVIHSQTVKQLPTRIRIEDTPADITILGGLGRVVGTGDFNGDGIEDFLRIESARRKEPGCSNKKRRAV